MCRCSCLRVPIHKLTWQAFFIVYKEPKQKLPHQMQIKIHVYSMSLQCDFNKISQKSLSTT